LNRKVSSFDDGIFRVTSGLHLLGLLGQDVWNTITNSGYCDLEVINFRTPPLSRPCARTRNFLRPCQLDCGYVSVTGDAKRVSRVTFHPDRETHPMQVGL